MYQANRAVQIRDRLDRSEAAYMYAQLGMPHIMIAAKLGIGHPSKLSPLLRNRSRDAMELDKLDRFCAINDLLWPYDMVERPRRDTTPSVPVPENAGLDNQDPTSSASPPNP